MVCGWIDGNDLAEAAVAYARRGWHVFPLATRSKLPAIAAKFGGRGVLDATPDEAKARSWWNINNTYNIGIATCIGFWAMDVDPRHGGDETLIALERQHGDLPHTVIGLTGGGGRHVLFKYVAGIRNSAQRRLGAGLDVRGEGGYIVAPPSVHESGRPYAWDVDHHPDDVPIAEAPGWLTDMARTPPKGEGVTLPESWRRLVADGVGEGARNEAVARLAGHLFRRGIDPFVTLDLCRCWNAQRCRPPLADIEVMTTVNSIAAAEEKRRRGTAQ
jgi:hypothetical protein